MHPHKLIFLPGAGGHPDFWRPMSNALRHIGEHVLMAWPGFGGIPAQADVTGMNDLVDRVVQQMDAPCTLKCQKHRSQSLNREAGFVVYDFGKRC